MEIRKPSWLKEWLDKLNWDILTWHLYIGDAIESAIDWAIDWLNYIVDQAEAAWTRAGVAWDKAVWVFNELKELITSEVSKLWNAIDTWWDDLLDWWEAKKGLILDWIDELKDNVLNWLRDFISFNWFKAWWGNTTTTFETWWDAKWLVILGAIETVVAPVRDEVNKHTAMLELVREFIDDPLEWLWHRFTDWFLGEE